MVGDTDRLFFWREDSALTSKQDPRSTDRRAALRQSLRAACQLRTTGLAPRTLQGETTDVSGSGLGVKLSSGGPGKLDALLESLVEDRLSVEVMIRLPQGSIRVEGHVVWWGLLGDDDQFSIRAGILLLRPWSDDDWSVIDKNLAG